MKKQLEYFLKEQTSWGVIQCRQQIKIKNKIKNDVSSTSSDQQICESTIVRRFHVKRSFFAQILSRITYAIGKDHREKTIRVYEKWRCLRKCVKHDSDH